MLRGDAGRTIRAAMADGLEKAPSAYPAAHSNFMRDVVWGNEALYQSALRCFRGVGRKHSTQTYKLHIISNTVRLAHAHRTGTYREKPPRIVPIEYPKKRTAMSIAFPDRVTQRSINDLALYPQSVKHFVYSNYACQKGKGTDAARDFYFAMHHRAYLKYGTSDYRIVVVDVKGYYDNMRHDTTNEMFRGMVDPWTAAQVGRILNKQYSGESGYNPGSQMVQIAGISYLNKLDHYVKETLRRKLYIRYMDDIHVIAKDDADAEMVLGEIKAQLASVGLSAHPVKSRVVKANDGVVFLGFLFKTLKSGKVLKTCDPKKVKANRRKLRRLTNKILRGETSPDALDESYQCIRAHMSKGNSSRLLRRMDEFFTQLKGEVQHGNAA